MVGRHLAAIDSVDLAHGLLYERMARFALHRLAAGLFDGLERRPGQTGVMHDVGAVQQGRQPDVQAGDAPEIILFMGWAWG